MCPSASSEQCVDDGNRQRAELCEQSSVDDGKRQGPLSCLSENRAAAQLGSWRVIQAAEISGCGRAGFYCLVCVIASHAAQPASHLTTALHMDGARI